MHLRERRALTHGVDALPVCSGAIDRSAKRHARHANLRKLAVGVRLRRPDAAVRQGWPAPRRLTGGAHPQPPQLVHLGRHINDARGPLCLRTATGASWR